MPPQNLLSPAEKAPSATGTITVAHFRTPFLSYSETFIFGLLDNFSRRIRSIAFTQEPISSVQFPYPRIVDYSIRRFSRQWVYDNIQRRVFGRHDVHLAAAMRSRGVQVMHAHFGEEAYWLLNVKKSLNLPMVTTFYGYDLSELLVQEVWRRRYQELFKIGDLFLVEGGHMKRALVQAGCPEDKVRIQRIGINLDKIPFRERRTADGKTIFLFCGRFIEKKGLIYALRACDRLVRQGDTNFEFRVVGNGPLFEEAEEFVESKGLEKQVKLLGRQPHSEFYRLLGEAHIFMAPSVTAANGDTEGGAPTTLLEAQASGMPVLASRHADIPEVMVEGKSGLLSDERDDAVLADNMRFMMKHPEEWPAFGRAGRQHMEFQHDIKREVLRLEEIYGEVLRRYGLDEKVSPKSFVLDSRFFSEGASPAASVQDNHALNDVVPETLSGPMLCPLCGTKLIVENGKNFRCNSCGRTVGRIEEGAFLFGELGKPLDPNSILIRLSNHLRQYRLEQISEMLYKDMAPDELTEAYSLLSVFYKGGWRFFSNLTPQKTVLSIEWGVGSASFAAASFVDRIFILHPVADVAKAIARQAVLLGYKNVQTLTVGKLDRLPFADGFFDVAAIHGLSRVLRESPKENLWADNDRFLREIRRVLKSDGTIYVERRFSRPTWGFNLMNARALISVRYTLNSLGLRWRKYLGFADEGPFIYKIIDFTRVRSLAERLKGFARLFLGVGRVGIMATGSEDGLNSVWLNRLADEVLASPEDVLNLHFGSAGVYRVHSEKCIVRIPFNGFAYRRCVNNMNALKRLGGLELSFATPYFLAQEELDAQPLFVESRLRAADVPYMEINSAQRQKYAADAAAMLTELHQKTLKRMTLDEEWFKTLFIDPLARVRSYVGRDASAALQKVEALLRQTMLNRPIDLVMLHGDFKITNLLQGPDGRLTGLFDWDMSRPLWLPGVDLVIYKGFDHCLETNHLYTQAIYEAGFELPGDPDIRNYRAAMGVDESGWKVLALMGLVHYFLNHLGEEKHHSAAWCEENINPFLIKACGHILDNNGSKA